MNEMTMKPISPELRKAARSGDKAAASFLLGESRDVGASSQLLSIDDVRIAVRAKDSPRLMVLMKSATGAMDPQMSAYSAERAWRLTQSFLREGKEREAVMMMACMPAQFHGSGRGKERNEALLLSSKMHMRPMSAMLLESGANPAYKGPDGKTALMHFASNGDPQLLGESFRLLEIAKEGSTAQAMAIKDTDGSMVGMHAVLSGASDLAKKKTLEVLALAGFDFKSSKNQNGFNELHMAAGRGDSVMINELVTVHKVGIETVSEKLWTPLMVAAYANQADAIGLLEKLGANLDMRHPVDGTCAAHLAAGQGANEALQALSKCGANMSIKMWSDDFSGASPADLAKAMGHRATQKIIKALEQPVDRNAAGKLSERLHDFLSPTRKITRPAGLSL